MVDYIVQGLYCDGTITDEETHDEEETAIVRAISMLEDPTFEGDTVRVITSDGELVWSPWRRA